VVYFDDPELWLLLVLGSTAARRLTENMTNVWKKKLEMAMFVAIFIFHYNMAILSQY